MTTLDELRKQLDAARTSRVDVEGATFKLRLPLAHRWRRVLEDNTDGSGSLRASRAFREILDEALVDWSGVTVKHFVPEAVTDDEIPYSDEARSMLLDSRQDIADALSAEVAAKNRAFNESLEANKKN